MKYNEAQVFHSFEEAFACGLNGREYNPGNFLTDEEKKIAEEKGVVIVYGVSDDLMELEGADCFEGGEIYIDRNGLVNNPHQECKRICSVWGEEGYQWTYKTNIPHETFDILEAGEKQCRGIIFNINSLAKPKAEIIVELLENCRKHLEANGMAMDDFEISIRASR